MTGSSTAIQDEAWPEAKAAAAARAGVRLRLDGELATVVLDKPERRNAMTPSTWWHLAEAGRALPGTVRAVLLRAEGPSFCAGLDRSVLIGGENGAKTLLDLATADQVDAEMTIEAFQEAFTWWRRPDLITVAAVQGHAVGAGFQLALACDLRLVSEDARFAMREITLGLVPDLGGTKPLVDLVGPARALEICATGRWIDADGGAAHRPGQQGHPERRARDGRRGLRPRTARRRPRRPHRDQGPRPERDPPRLRLPARRRASRPSPPNPGLGRR